MEDVLGALAIGTGLLWTLYQVYWRSDEARIARGMRRTRRRDIADVRDGRLVKIVGTVEYAAPPMSAPMSGSSCALYEVLVRYGLDKKTLREVQGRELIVRDHTGTARVRVDGALGRELLVALRTQQVYGESRSSLYGTNLDAVIDAYLAEHDISPYRPLAVYEAVIRADQELAVVGIARFEPDPDPVGADGATGYRELPMRLVITGSSRTPLLLSDQPDLVASARRG